MQIVNEHALALAQPLVDERADLVEDDAARVEEHEVGRVVPREGEVAHALVRIEVGQLAAGAQHQHRALVGVPADARAQPG